MWRSAAVLGLFAATVAAVVPDALAGTTLRHGATRKAVPHGFFVSRHGHLSRVTASRGSSRLVIDGRGTQHVVTDINKSETASKLVYLTHRSGRSGWTSHPIATQPDPAIEVESHLSTSGRRIFAVFYECKGGIFASEAAIGARRLPKPDVAVAGTGDHCNIGDDNSVVPRDFVPVERAAALAGQRVGVLTSNPAGTRWHVAYGVPGQHPFAAGSTLPTAHHFIPSQITRDAKTGQILVDGTGTAAGNEADYVVTAKSATGKWSGLSRIASLHNANDNFFMSNIVANKGHVYVGLDRPQRDVSVGGHALYYVSRSPAGTWSHPTLIPHTNRLDQDVRLALNPDTARLHAAWDRRDTASKHRNGGIYQSVLSRNGKWSKPKQFSHYYQDVPRDVELTPAGLAAISFKR